jgi:hypothetical protein
MNRCTLHCFGEQTVRIAFSKKNHGYLYYINASPNEWLDVARGLWLMGCTYLSAWSAHDLSTVQSWRFGHTHAEAKLARRSKGGYSNA